MYYFTQCISHIKLQDTTQNSVAAASTSLVCKNIMTVFFKHAEMGWSRTVWHQYTVFTNAASDTQRPRSTPAHEMVNRIQTKS